MLVPDPMVFPATILAVWIGLVIWAGGYASHRIEIATGQAPWWHGWWWAASMAWMVALIWAAYRWEFAGTLVGVSVGLFLGGASAYYGYWALRSLGRGRSSPREPQRRD